MTIIEKPCGSCGAPIYWLHHETTRKPAPIEVGTSVDGNILINLTTGSYHIATLDERDANRDWLHLNHFATCPQARTWAKAGRSA